MDLQIGANEGQIMSIRIPRVTPQTLGVDKVNIGTADGAQKAISLLDIAINEVSAIRSKLGAYQNRLEHSISNLDVTSENMTESLSRIEDVDMASEMAEYTQKNVLAQAGVSMLAQANMRPQNILSLLQQ
jgi:flagellin